MEAIRVTTPGAGRQALHGTVAVRGAKNSALKLMAAALLAPGGPPWPTSRTSSTSSDGPAPRELGCTVDASTTPPARRCTSTCPRSWATRRRTTWSAGCAPRSACSARWSPGAAGRGSRCPAGTTSAPAAWTCT